MISADRLELGAKFQRLHEICWSHAMTKIMIELPDDAVALLAREAEALGLTPEALASEALQQWIGDDLDWDEDIRRLEEPGESIPLDVAFDRANAVLAAAHAKSK